MRVNDKVGIVTGAGAGIGKATALLLAKEGASVCAADSNAEAAEATAQEIRGAGGEAFSATVDVSSDRDCQVMVEATIHRWGKLDFLCNIAGIVLGGILNLTPEGDWDKSIDVNLKSIYLVSRHALPYLKKSGSGSIVNMASVAGFMGVRNRAAYSASKGGVIALTKSMAIDYVEDNIRVNSVCPGTVDSPSLQKRLESLPDPVAARRDFISRQPMKRFGRPDEIANVVLFLCSDESSFITGIELTVDGGMSL